MEKADITISLIRPLVLTALSPINFLIHVEVFQLHFQSSQLLISFPGKSSYSNNRNFFSYFMYSFPRSGSSAFNHLIQSQLAPLHSSCYPIKNIIPGLLPPSVCNKSFALLTPNPPGFESPRASTFSPNTIVDIEYEEG